MEREVNASFGSFPHRVRSVLFKSDSTSGAQKKRRIADDTSGPFFLVAIRWFNPIIRLLSHRFMNQVRPPLRRNKMGQVRTFRRRGIYTPPVKIMRIKIRRMAGQTIREIAKVENLSKNTVSRVLSQDETNELINGYRSVILQESVPLALKGLEELLKKADRHAVIQTLYGMGILSRGGEIKVAPYCARACIRLWRRSSSKKVACMPFAGDATADGNSPASIPRLSASRWDTPRPR